MRNQNPRVLKSGEQTPEFYKNLWDTIISGKQWRGNLHNKKKNGDVFWESASISPVLDEKGAVTNFIAVKEDITDKLITEERLQIVFDNVFDEHQHFQRKRGY